MIDRGRHSVLGVNVSAIDYEAAVERITTAARERRPLSVTALAVHGVMTGHADPRHRGRLNALDLVTPDGQPVRWALKWLHGIDLPDRVYGPTLTTRVLAEAERTGLAVGFYGSRPATLERLVANVQRDYPALRIAAHEPSRFGRVTDAEQREINERIRASGASIVFVGLGCPRQEVWAYENVRALGMPVLAVGAAFDFLAGTLPQAPPRLQRRGLEWAFRLVQEPSRLWRRYLVLGPKYLWYVLMQYLRLRDVPVTRADGSEPRELFG